MKRGWVIGALAAVAVIAITSVASLSRPTTRGVTLEAAAERYRELVIGKIKSGEIHVDAKLACVANDISESTASWAYLDALTFLPLDVNVIGRDGWHKEYSAAQTEITEAAKRCGFDWATSNDSPDIQNSFQVSLLAALLLAGR